MDGWLPPQRVSRGDDWQLLPQLRADFDGYLYCCWVSVADVRDPRGVIDQWHSIRCAERRDFGEGEWRPLGKDEFGTVADVCHGLLAREAIWGYLGRRRHAFLRLDWEGVPWVLWEAKVDPDGPVSPGKLLGEYCPAAGVSQCWELATGHVYYELENRWRSPEQWVWAVMRKPHGREAWDIWLDKVHFPAGGPKLDTAVEDWSRWERISLPAHIAPSPPRPRLPHEGREYRLLFGDVHAHSGLSADAEGEPDELLRYARDKAGLDFVALIDNDCYQCPLTASQFRISGTLADRFTRDGEFVVLPGYEWTLWDREHCPHPDHRTVLLPREREIIRHVDPGDPTTQEMAARIAELGGLLFTQHWGWTLTDSPAEAGLEVCSAWAYYIDKPEPFFRDLCAGRRLAFVGGSDSHRRNPGTCGALTAVYAESLTREAIFEALRSRRCYATTGSKMVLDVRVNGAPMGSEIAASGPVTVHVMARGTRPLERIAVWRGTVRADPPDVREVFAAHVGGREAQLDWTDAEPLAGTLFYYVVVKQQGEDVPLSSNLAAAEGSRAWSSAVWKTGE